MKTFTAFLFLACCSLLPASSEDKKRLSIETTQSMNFPATGDILIRGSFGELEVEGWNRPEVEITVVKGTRKRYELNDQENALRQLNGIEVVATAESPGRLVIETTFPGRNLLTRPLRGKSNVELVYKIKAPPGVSLAIEHDIGSVRVKNIAGDVKVTARIGEISLDVPQDENYAINASVRLGEVDTDFPGESGRKFLSESFLAGNDRQTRRIYARLGIGQITIRRMQAASPASRRELMAAR